jgi:hypothetical protein
MMGISASGEGVGAASSSSVTASSSGGAASSSSAGGATAPSSSVTAEAQDVSARVVTIKQLTTNHTIFFFISPSFQAILHIGL